MKLLLAFLVLSLLALVLAEEEASFQKRTCPGGNTCNGHGSCGSDGRCTCQDSWAGDDCSFPVYALASGVSMPNQRVTRGSWIMYTISTTSGNGLVVSVHQEPAGDVDLYMLQNTYPTRSNSAYRDTGTSSNFNVTVDNAGTNKWYIGMYGYLASTFTITASVSGSQCPDLNNCNGHGTCTSSGVCTCNDGWVGRDCSSAITTVTPNGPAVIGNVGRDQWNYFQFTLTSSNLIQVVVNETVAGGDSDLYIKYGSIPNAFSFDYRDTSIARNFEIDIAEPQLGTWYVGLFGYRNTSYQFAVKTANVNCASRCSLHGTCTGGSCVCYTGFSGVACENMDADAVVGVVYVGFVDDSSWNFYKIRPFTTSNTQVTVTQSLGGDCDVYIKQGRAPTKTDYTYRDVSLLLNVTLTIVNPSDTYWYIGVFGYSACQYTMRIAINSMCPGTPPCSGHGSCQSGICVCNPGYNGPDCSQSGNYLTNGASVTSNSLSQYAWEFFTITVVNTTYMAVDVKELSSTGSVWLFASKGQVPDLRRYDYSDQETNSKYHRLHITFDSPQTDVWQIGVYGNPFAERSPISYTVAAWYTPF